MNNRNEKRRLRQEEADREHENRMAEHRRKDSLTMWERIEELNESQEVKDILHRLANGERE